VSVFERARELLSSKNQFGLEPEDVGFFPCGLPPGEQHILRMMLKRAKGEIRIPVELEWVAPILREAWQLQRENGFDPSDDFIYVTVRHGVVKSVTDDLWHVDGFSMRAPHRPEQNYIWANRDGTEWLDQPMFLPDDFDPMRNNVHQYFQDVAADENVRHMRCEHLYRIDPYVIHRRPRITQGTLRSFFRISFVPIEIEDDTCTQNPLLPSGPYNRPDIRNTLTRWRGRS
jgi:hypothetical protein